MATIPDIIVKWSGKEYPISGLFETQCVLDLKNEIHKHTGVLPGRQKVLGLKHKGKPAADDAVLGEIKLKPNTKLMMMGTREEEIEKIIEPPEDLPEVLNDFDLEEDDEIAIENRDVYLAKINRRVREYKIDMINEPRPGKKLLVLDIDYTLFDHRSAAETGTQLMRPFLHEFLTSAYEDYDIVIWSATGMKWIKAKMEELAVNVNKNYKLTFMLDDLAMITVHSEKYGVIDVKPLGVIWGKFEGQYTEKNTIMFDDIRRNFLMNPQQGLKIRAFRQAHQNRATDRELLHLGRYLKDIADLDDLSELNHRKWERYSHKANKHKRRHSSDSHDAATSTHSDNPGHQGDS